MINNLKIDKGLGLAPRENKSRCLFLISQLETMISEVRQEQAEIKAEQAEIKAEQAEIKANLKFELVQGEKDLKFFKDLNTRMDLALNH